jgi:hypothetical protein
MNSVIDFSKAHKIKPAETGNSRVIPALQVILGKGYGGRSWQTKILRKIYAATKRMVSGFIYKFFQQKFCK